MLAHTRLESSHLAGNLLGDPSERDLFVYLPPGYEESDERYPTAYLLQAYGTTVAEMVTPPTDGERWRPPIEDVIEPVFRRMGAPPMVVAIPDGWSRWGCGQWVDSPVTGNFEQYLLHDVVQTVDASYRTIPDAPSRGVFGFSSGGFGAWNVASRNPEVFGALAMLSGDSFLDMTHKFMPYKLLRQHLAGAAQRPDRGERLVGARLRLLGDVFTQPGSPSVLRRPTRCLAQRRADSGSLGPLAGLRPGRQRARPSRQSQKAVGHPLRRGLERRLQPALGSPAPQPLFGRGRNRPRTTREPRESRRPSKRALPGRTAMVVARPGR